MTYVSPDDALKLVAPTERESVEALGINPYPPGFWLKMTDPSQAKQRAPRRWGRSRRCIAAARLRASPTASQITKKVLNTTKYILYFLTGLMMLLAVAAVVLIQNTIRLSIFSRRREIEVMKLVGATNSFVRLPFMLEGMITGVSGAVGRAGAADDRLRRAQQHPARPHRPGAIGRGVHPDRCCSSGSGLVLGAFSSVLTLRRFLRV